MALKSLVTRGLIPLSENHSLPNAMNISAIETSVFLFVFWKCMRRHDSFSVAFFN
jgi:hypothetical protein